MRFSILALVVGLYGCVNGQVIQYCAPGETDVCYSVNIPATSASSGQGDLYFQIQGPSSLQWIGIGQGAQMAGANIFMVYSNGNGNLTLSPRLGKGNYMPNYDSAAQVSLLDGSGISNNTMTANVRCTNCASWDGGSMSFSDPASSWIWAVKEGSPVASTSQTVNLQQHNVMGAFNLDLTKAAGGNSLNPFANDATATTTASASASSSTSGSSGGGDASGGGGEDGSQQPTNAQVLAHGFLMSLAFLIFFPFGALTVRLLSVKGIVWIHAGAQLFAYLVALAGFGIGVYLAVVEGEVNSYHPIIGIIVISLLLFQPIVALIHHSLWKKEQKRTAWAYAHIWYGRTLIVLGIINGGLGLELSSNTVKGEIAYGVIAGVVFLLYVGVVLFVTMRDNGNEQGETGPKVGPSHGSDSPLTEEGIQIGEK